MRCPRCELSAGAVLRGSSRERELKSPWQPRVRRSGSRTRDVRHFDSVSSALTVSRLQINTLRPGESQELPSAGASTPSEQLRGSRPMLGTKPKTNINLLGQVEQLAARLEIEGHLPAKDGTSERASAGALGLPLSPLMDPALIAARTRHRGNKPRPAEPATEFERALASNPFGAF